MRTRKPQNSTGVTLIELMVAVAVLAILISMAAPSFSALIQDIRLSTAVNDLNADLALARSEAAKRGRRVSVCASNNGTSCAGTNWNAGRIVFVDSGTSGSVDNGDEILRVGALLPGQASISIGGAATGYIQYRPRGITSQAALVTFTLCDDRNGAFGRQLRVNAAGLAALATGINCT